MDIKLLSNLESVLKDHNLELKKFNGIYTLIITDKNLKWTLNDINVSICLILNGKTINVNTMIETLELLNNEVDSIEPIIEYKLNKETNFELKKFHVTKNHLKIIFTPYDMKAENSIVSYISSNCNSNHVFKKLKEKNIKLKDWMVQLSELFVSKKSEIKKSLKNIIKYAKRYSVKSQ
ncbi:MAG: hypothetical protein CMF62_00565 [Magnetococcales bacterium]|nr:hypothetical protein [Magnetococcales bacterium]|tara:strand:+ start:5128 stop:5661 length:534 start_codon:yes stop_codon:yes gene_type:complete